MKSLHLKTGGKPLQAVPFSVLKGVGDGVADQVITGMLFAEEQPGPEIVRSIQ